MRRDISLNGWRILGTMAAVMLGVWLGILRMFLWANG
jgi:hypothetical protein